LTSRDHRLLLLFPGALGDFLCALPSFLALQRTGFTESLIVANPSVLELVEYGPFRTASIQRREVADLFAAADLRASTRALFGGFDAVHSWTGHGDANFSARLRSITAGVAHVHRFRDPAPSEHAADYYARCAGVQRVPAQVWTSATDEAWLSEWSTRHLGGDDPLLVLHPGSGAPRKNWQGFAQLVPPLRSWWQSRHGGKVVMLLGPADEQTSNFHVDVSTLRDAGLRKVAALLRRAAFYVGNDSGISHLAGVVGTPSLVLFGATDPQRWAPRGPAVEVIESRLPCSQCGPEHLCTHRIPVERVLTAVKRRAGRPAD
jgi:Glycosyltransferase family 9 (heptosyltransferase)